MRNDFDKQWELRGNAADRCRCPYSEETLGDCIGKARAAAEAMPSPTVGRPPLWIPYVAAASISAIMSVLVMACTPPPKSSAVTTPDGVSRTGIINECVELIQYL